MPKIFAFLSVCTTVFTGSLTVRGSNFNLGRTVVDSDEGLRRLKSGGRLLLLSNWNSNSTGNSNSRSQHSTLELARNYSKLPAELTLVRVKQVANQQYPKYCQ